MVTGRRQPAAAPKTNQKEKSYGKQNCQGGHPHQSGGADCAGLEAQKAERGVGPASPLKTIKNWANFAALATTADTQQTQADQLSKQAETATENREIALGNDGPLRENTVRFFVLAGRDLLLGANKGNEHLLGDYGFTVGHLAIRRVPREESGQGEAKKTARA